MTSRPSIQHRYLPVQCYGSARRDFAPRRLKPLGIVQHYFSGRYAFPEKRFDQELCWRLMHDLNFEPDERKFGIYDGPRVAASAHFIIGRNGEIWQLVPHEFVAWHAGKSAFGGLLNCNDFMIGIENVGTGDTPFTELQYQANASLCAWLMAKYDFGQDMIAGHSDVAIPEGRKKDPGPYFDWHYLHTLIQDIRSAS